MQVFFFLRKESNFHVTERVDFAQLLLLPEFQQHYVLCVLNKL